MYRVFVAALVILNLSATPLLAQRFRGFPHFVPRPMIISPNVRFLPTLPAGNFVHVTPGNFMPANRMFIPRATGNAFLTGQGVFNPMRGTFVPARNGNFLLTIREAFNPKTASFVPSPNGTIPLTVRGDLVASTTGMAAGSFLPFASLVPLTSARMVFVPISTTNPYLSALTNPYMAGLSNPYMASSYPMPYSMPYAASYSSSYPAANYGATASTPAMLAAPQASTGADVLAAYGIPTEDGHISWPLAFRLLPADKQQELLKPLESELALAAGHAASGASTSAALGEIQKHLSRLSTWIKAHQIDMAEGTYRDGLNFLRMLEGARTALRS